MRTTPFRLAPAADVGEHDHDRDGEQHAQRQGPRSPGGQGRLPPPRSSIMSSSS